MCSIYWKILEVELQYLLDIICTIVLSDYKREMDNVPADGEWQEFNQFLFLPLASCAWVSVASQL